MKKSFPRNLVIILNLLKFSKCCGEPSEIDFIFGFDGVEGRELEIMDEKDENVSPSTLLVTNPSPFPTMTPTFNPTHDKPSSSFSYNPYAKHGPNNWDKVEVGNNEYKEFKRVKAATNQCDSGGQSPVDLHHNAKCIEHHQIRTRVRELF